MWKVMPLKVGCGLRFLISRATTMITGIKASIVLPSMKAGYAKCKFHAAMIYLSALDLIFRVFKSKTKAINSIFMCTPCMVLSKCVIMKASMKLVSRQVKASIFALDLCLSQFGAGTISPNLIMRQSASMTISTGHFINRLALTIMIHAILASLSNVTRNLNALLASNLSHHVIKTDLLLPTAILLANVLKTFVQRAFLVWDSVTTLVHRIAIFLMAVNKSIMLFLSIQSYNNKTDNESEPNFFYRCSTIISPRFVNYNYFFLNVRFR
mmetsp:Transcript_3599/g.5360  ORF Transcript_3599/g.5360 Transcript_3599/m.5360 type:complete len:268 (-) Transcript_3599:24-827(-)